MEIRLRDGWQALYRFDLQAQLVSDYEITSWYLCHHPDSHFRAGLIAARSAPGRRYTLRDTELAVHHLNGPTERRVLTTAAELRATLEDTFRLRVPQRPEVRAAFERLTSGTPEAATA
jgi:N-hydroxyarylamine O-acetyltransferase